MPKKHIEVFIDEIKHCDVCKQQGIEKEAKYDAKTRFGPWGYLCSEHFLRYGLGLGLGRGQRLILRKED